MPDTVKPKIKKSALAVIEPDDTRREEYLEAYTRWKQLLEKMI